MEISEVLNSFVIDILGIVLTGIATWLGIKVKKLINRKEVTEILEQQRGIIKVVVRFVEQAFQELDGPEKLEKAKSESLIWLNAIGLKITEQQLNLIIESAVHELALAKKEAEQVAPTVTVNTEGISEPSVVEWESFEDLKPKL